MSLTSQIKDKKSNVTLFFNDFEDKGGMLEMLNKMQLQITPDPILFKPESIPVTSSYLGFMADLAFRIIVGGESFDLMKTIAFKDGFLASKDGMLSINALRELCKKAISGNCKYVMANDVPDFFVERSDSGFSYDEFCKSCILKLTSFAVIEAYVRSRTFPKIFSNNMKNMLLSKGYLQEIQIDGRREYVHCLVDEKMMAVKSKLMEITTIESYFEFYEKLGGSNFSSELLLIIKKIAESINNSLSGMNMIVSNAILENAEMVGGADFDAIIGDKQKTVLVEIKTTRKGITINSMRQLVGYILLLGENDSPKPVTHAGFYYPITGEFNYYHIETIIKTVLPKFRTLNSARNRFIKYCKKRTPKTTKVAVISSDILDVKVRMCEEDEILSM